MIPIDGAQGEGGGQVLRTSLALAALTGQPFHARDIRAGRAKPGLLRQHLAAVRAAAAITGAEVEGAELGSTELVFVPGALRAGDFRFAVGSAGSAALVLQTVLLPLLAAPGPSTVRVEGGTHASAAPPFPFLERAFLPALRAMGADVSLTLDAWGFFPAGGGALRAEVRPGPLGPLERRARGPLLALTGHAAVSALPDRLGHRALARFRDALDLPREALRLHAVPRPVGPGMVAWVEATWEGGAEVFTGFSERRADPEAIADAALTELRAWRDAEVPVGEHLADQLLLPLALAGGAFRTTAPSLHTRTNATVIERFLPVRFSLGEEVTVER